MNLIEQNECGVYVMRGKHVSKVPTLVSLVHRVVLTHSFEISVQCLNNLEQMHRMQ